MIAIPGCDVSIPAVKVAHRESRQHDAWTRQGYVTVRLVERLAALRVHARGGAGAARHAALTGSGRRGRWYAIGDVILTREQYANAHALPGPFSHQDEWLLDAGSVLNVGIAGPLFGHDGGGAQPEFLDGPAPMVVTVPGYWSSRAGNA